MMKIHLRIAVEGLNYMISNCTPISVGLPQQRTIERSESFNYHYSNTYRKAYTPVQAHDGNYNTWYGVKDGKVAGNFLKLYLSQAYSITSIEITSRSGSTYIQRMKNTEGKVYVTMDEEIEVESCGVLTG